MKKRSDAKKSTSAALQAELPENSKIYSSDTIEECQQVNLLHSFSCKIHVHKDSVKED
jgi:hypothetical protein